MPSLLKSGLRQVVSCGSKEATPSFINVRIFSLLVWKDDSSSSVQRNLVAGLRRCRKGAMSFVLLNE